jgi:hypothetical protein
MEEADLGEVVVVVVVEEEPFSDGDGMEQSCAVRTRQLGMLSPLLFIKGVLESMVDDTDKDNCKGYDKTPIGWRILVDCDGTNVL